MERDQRLSTNDLVLKSIDGQAGGQLQICPGAADQDKRATTPTVILIKVEAKCETACHPGLGRGGMLGEKDRFITTKLLNELAELLHFQTGWDRGFCIFKLVGSILCAAKLVNNFVRERLCKINFTPAPNHTRNMILHDQR